MQVKKQNNMAPLEMISLHCPKYTPETSCRTVAARTYVKENAENYQKMPKKKEKKEIRLDKSRFDWDTNAPP